MGWAGSGRTSKSWAWSRVSDAFVQHETLGFVFYKEKWCFQVKSRAWGSLGRAEACFGLMASAEALCSAGIPRMRLCMPACRGGCGAGLPRRFPGRPHDHQLAGAFWHLFTTCPREAAHSKADSCCSADSCCLGSPLSLGLSSV